MYEVSKIKIRWIVSLLIVFGITGCSKCSRLGWGGFAGEELEVQEPVPKIPGQMRFHFEKLKGDVVAQSGELTLKKNIWDDIALNALLKERDELQVAFVYEQVAGATEFLSGEERNLMRFEGKTPSRSLANILNQYGVAKSAKWVVEFSGVDSTINSVTINGTVHSMSKFPIVALPWGSIQSRIFRRKLDLIEKRLEELHLVSLAKAAGKTPNQFIEETIVAGQQAVSAKERKKLVSQFLEKNHIKFPITVSLTQPQFQYDVTWDWTPSLGDPKSSRRVVVITDFLNNLSRQTLEWLPQLAEEFPAALFGFRPYFPLGDRYQTMVADMVFCSWMEDQENFWNVLPGLLAVEKSDVEQGMLSHLESLGSDVKNLQACFYKRKYKDAVEYHQKYAEYLGVHSMPSILVGGEVFLGPVSYEQLREALGRFLKQPTVPDYGGSKNGGQ